MISSSGSGPKMAAKGESLVDAPALYLVATPLGNLGDITFRAVEILKQVTWVACEDTRRTRIIFKRYAIDTPLELYHDRNQARKTPRLIRKLSAGQSCALVSDAGSPGIADPGFTLVRAALSEGIPIIPVPGPSAAIAAVTASGLPCERFAFEGYLPRTSAGRRKRLRSLKDEGRTIVFFLSPHRFIRELSDLHEHLGDRMVCLAREMTKIHEEFQRGTLLQLIAWGEKQKLRGELTLVVGAAGPESELHRL